MGWLSFVAIVTILFVRLLDPSMFIIDGWSIFLILLVAVPFIAPWVKKLKAFGAEFQFKDGIEKASKYVALAEEYAESLEVEKEGGVHEGVRSYDTFPLDDARHVLDIDPNLALAAIRINIEKVLSMAVVGLLLDAQGAKIFNLRRAAQLLHDNGRLHESQLSAIFEIVSMCNEAVHGASVTRDEAISIIELTDKLNQSFPTGYSISLIPNEEYAQNDYVCEYEHCIEEMPLGDDGDSASCHIYGHVCPGGAEHREECEKSIEDIPLHRFPP
jgi:hypothetical protein